MASQLWPNKRRRQLACVGSIPACRAGTSGCFIILNGAWSNAVYQAFEDGPLSTATLPELGDSGLVFRRFAPFLLEMLRRGQRRQVSVDGAQLRQLMVFG